MQPAALEVVVAAPRAAVQSEVTVVALLEAAVMAEAREAKVAQLAATAGLVAPVVGRVAAEVAGWAVQRAVRRVVFGPMWTGTARRAAAALVVGAATASAY